MRTLKTAVSVAPAMLFSLPVYAEPFLTSPLQCADPKCAVPYSHGVYTPGIMNSVLDHSLKHNPNNNFWQYGTIDTGGGDGVVRAFNGDTANGPLNALDHTCIGSTIDVLAPLTNSSGCGSKYASYDEHPGYDYRAALNTKVKAAAPGYVVGGVGCIETNVLGGCSASGFIGIDHDNGYITQYGHLSVPYVTAGSAVYEGQVIGLAGHKGLKCSPSCPDHLHFEVLKQGGNEYLVVDPYGWTGPGGPNGDPLYSASMVAPALLWRCDNLSAADPIPAGYGAAYDLFALLKNVLLRASCEGTNVAIRLGNGLSTQFIYRTGYELRNNAWTPITFTGSNPSGEWFVGQAQATLTRTPSELGGANYFVAYICTQLNGAWKCGCRDSACNTPYWQLQGFGN